MHKSQTSFTGRALHIKALVLFFVTLTASSQNKPPNCTKNFIPPSGPKDANGKTIVPITVLTSGNYGWSGSSNGVDPVVQNALTCAIGLWNNAAGSNGQGIAYSFTQSGNDLGSATIIINKDATPGSPVAVTKNYPDGQGNYGVPSVVSLNPTSTSIDTTLCATLAHEIGHTIGLSDAATGTIMGPVVRSTASDGSYRWTNATQKVQKNDVDSVQFSVSNQSQCKDVAIANSQGNDSNGSCQGTAPNSSCFCDTTTNQYECSCDGAPTGCSDGSSSYCIDGSWQCASVSTTQCDGTSPCEGAVCSGDNTWDTSQCTSVTTSQCDGDAPCAGAVCSANNVWDTSSCSNGCSDVCDPSCYNYDYCSCYPGDSSCTDPGGGCVPNYDACDPDSCNFDPELCSDDPGCNGQYACQVIPVRGGVAIPDVDPNLLPNAAVQRSTDQAHPMSYASPSKLSQQALGFGAVGVAPLYSTQSMPNTRSF